MKKCRHCGAPIEDACDTICAYCGEPLGNGQSAAEPYSHQEYTQQHTAQQYSRHTDQQYTYEHNKQQYTQQQKYEMQRQRHEQQMRQQHLPNTINPYDQKRTEAGGKAYTAMFLAILAIPFCSMFVFAIIALVMASSVIKDPNADETAIKTAKNAKLIAIISLCLGVLFFLGQIITIVSAVVINTKV